MRAPAKPASAEPNAKVSAYMRAVEMPQTRANIGFSSAPRILRPVEVLVKKIQLPPMTTIVTAIMKHRQAEKLIAPIVTKSGQGSGTDLYCPPRYVRRVSLITRPIA